MEPKRRTKKSTTIRAGASTVRIFHRKIDGYGHHTVAWYEAGKRRRKVFGDFRAASRYARGVVAPEIRKGALVALRLTGSDREAYIHATKLLQPLGVPLSVAVEDYVRRCQGTNDKPLKEVVDEFLSSRSGDRHRETLSSHLKRFADTFHYKIGAINTSMMVKWLDGFPDSARTRQNRRNSLVNLFHFARRHGYLARNIPTEADHIETVRVQQSEPGILTPAQLSRLLEILDGEPQLSLYVVLGAFSGIRSAELLKLNWSNFRTDPGYINVDKNVVAKKGYWRYVPILPNLAAYLEPYAKARGRLFKTRRMVDRLTGIAKRNGLSWPNNCLRHSFASYRIAATQNWNQVADEMGTSYAKLKSNYRKPIKPETGEAWFAIRPKPFT